MFFPYDIVAKVREVHASGSPSHSHHQADNSNLECCQENFPALNTNFP